ncbi:MAG: hypothetical protein M3Q50_02795 [Chloroflexota bacterium]|nr:hypothetical protein [Chloroflexota bacterium]
MVKEREMVTIQLDPESELAKALAGVDTKPIVLVSNGRRFVVSHDPFDPVDDYDPEAFRTALRAAAGTFTPEEGERLKQDIYRWREEGTRPVVGPRYLLESD